MWNSYANPLIQDVAEIPVILNMTQAFKTGPSYTVTEFVQYISYNKDSLSKIVKNKLVK